MVLMSQYSIAFNDQPSTTLFESINFPEHVIATDETPKEKWDKAIGTFQFEILKGRKLTEINITIIEEIEKNRHETDIVYIQYSERIRIKILPKNVISGSFEKLELKKTVDSFDNN